jgi:glycerol-3-phosphate dehydrogenase (NAD(P)+)
MHFKSFKKLSTRHSSWCRLKPDEAKQKVGQVAEGVRTLVVIKEESSKLNIKMPLVDSLHDIIYKNSSPDILIDD